MAPDKKVVKGIRNVSYIIFTFNIDRHIENAQVDAPRIGNATTTTSHILKRLRND